MQTKENIRDDNKKNKKSKSKSEGLLTYHIHQTKQDCRRILLSIGVYSLESPAHSSKTTNNPNHNK